MRNSEVYDYIALTKIAEGKVKDSFTYYVLIRKVGSSEMSEFSASVSGITASRAQMLAVLYAAKNLPRPAKSVIYTCNEVVSSVFMGQMKAKKHTDILSQFQSIYWEGLDVKWVRNDELRKCYKVAKDGSRPDTAKDVASVVSPPKGRPALFWFETEEGDVKELFR